MTREDRKLWTRVIKNQEDTAKIAAYKQQIRDAIQDLDVRIFLHFKRFMLKCSTDHAASCDKSRQ